jgi:hypothetical protein
MSGPEPYTPEELDRLAAQPPPVAGSLSPEQVAYCERHQIDPGQYAALKAICDAPDQLVAWRNHREKGTK